jgi:hypothetical protein
MTHGLYDPEQDSTPVQRFAMVKPGSVRRAWWHGFWAGLAVAAAVVAVGVMW